MLPELNVRFFHSGLSFNRGSMSLYCLPLPNSISFNMLIATQAKSVEGTQKYFEQVLTRGDYYLGQEVGGQWHGKGAELLGLGKGSDVTKEQFSNLLKGYHPESGEKLTQRIRKDRRPGMDLTFSVPKSVSLAWAINDNEKIVEAIRESCLLYTSPSPRDRQKSRMPSSA